MRSGDGSAHPEAERSTASWPAKLEVAQEAAAAWKEACMAAWWMRLRGIQEEAQSAVVCGRFSSPRLHRRQHHSGGRRSIDLGGGPWRCKFVCAAICVRQARDHSQCHRYAARQRRGGAFWSTSTVARLSQKRIP